MITEYPIYNNVLCFYRGEFSQWWGSFKNQNSTFKIDISEWSNFFRKWYEYDSMLNVYDLDYGYEHGSSFQCAEQAMMFGKAIIFGDFETADKILSVIHASEMQALGRQVKNFDEKWWSEIRLPLVTMVNYHKFKSNKEIGAALLDSQPYILAEASPDLIWGTGVEGDLNGDVKNWIGQNLLGRALMRVREQLSDLKNE